MIRTGLAALMMVIAPIAALAQDLGTLTVPGDRLPAGCGPQAPVQTTRVLLGQQGPMEVRNGNIAPYPSNPWKGTDRFLASLVRRSIDGSAPEPDGPPLDPRQAAAFARKYVEHVEEAYAATYSGSSGSPVSVQAVRFDSASLASPEPPAGNTRVRRGAEQRIVLGKAVVLISADRAGECFDAIVSHVRAEAQQDPSQLIGLWRGTSTCTDRVAAPACQDEQVVYEFKPGAKAGVVHWVADKIVNGKREPMGELDMEYDRTEACWKVEFTSPRTKVVWRLAVDGTHMTGTARLLPGNETVRKVDLRKQ